MIGTQIEITYTDGAPSEVVSVTHYAIGRIARWARLNGMPGLSPDTASSLADQVLFGELVNGGSVTVAVVGVGPDAKLELIAVPPRPARPKAIPGPKASKKKAADKAEDKPAEENS